MNIEAYLESTTKLSIFEYADEIDKDFREQTRATGILLPQKFNENLLKIIKMNETNFQEFSKSFGYTDKQFRIWREGKAAIPLKVLTEIWKKAEINIEDLEKYIENYFRVFGVVIDIKNIV